MTDQITTHASGGMVFEGSGIETFRLLVIAQALELYAKTGIRANTAYTPTAMLRNAAQATGRLYKRGQYYEAAADLRQVVENLRSKIEFVNE
jgi:hypothetical protein